MAKKPTAKPVVTDAEWLESLATWKTGITMGKPDAASVIRLQIEKLDREASALRIRCSVIAQAIGDVESGAAANRLALVEKDLANTEAKVGVLADLLASTRMVKDRDEGTTPEQAAKPARRYDAVAALELSQEQRNAASDIQLIHEAIARAGNARIGQMDAAGRAPQGVYREAEIFEKTAERRHTRYLPWTDHLHHHAPATLALIDAVVIRNIPLDKARRKHRLQWDDAMAKVRDGLDMYWKEWSPVRHEMPESIRASVNGRH